MPATVIGDGADAPPLAANEIIPPLPILTIRELRRNRSFAPGGEHSGELVAAYLPLVSSALSFLLPQSGYARVSELVTAIFQSFSLRWRRIPRRTVIATWLLRSSLFMAQRERKRAGCAKPNPKSVGDQNLLIIQQLLRLRPALSNAVVLATVLRQPTARCASALRLREKRLLKIHARALHRLALRTRKIPLEREVGATLASVVSAVPEEIRTDIVAQVAPPRSTRPPKTTLVRELLWSWRWFGLRRRLKRVARGLAIGISVFLTLAFTMKWLAESGRLTAWFIRFGGQQLVRDIPALAQPARPWPITPEDKRLTAHLRPETSADLYNLTNIWTAHLSFTPAQWRAIQPGHVQPIGNMMGPDGHLTLRNPKAQRNGLAGVIGIDFGWSEAKLDFGDTHFDRVAVRYRGNGTFVNSLYGPKQSFKIDLNKFVKKQTLGGVDKLNLVNAIPDSSYIHDALAEQLFRELGTPAPRTAYCYLTVDAPEKYTNQAFGLYVMVENIDSDYAKDRFGSRDIPIFKPVTPYLFKDIGPSWTNYAAIYDLKTKATAGQLQRVVDFAQLVTHADDEEFARKLPEYLDLEEFAAFLAGHVLISAYDGFLENGQNYYLYLDPKSNRFGFIPWDHDHSWGEFGYVGTADQREHASIWRPATYNFTFVDRVLKVESFRKIYRAKLGQALARSFTTDRLFPQIDALAALIRPAVAAESDFRLKRFDQAVSDQWVPGPRENGNPEGPKAPVHQLKRFITNRIPAIREQLEGKSEGARLKGHR